MASICNAHHAYGFLSILDWLMIVITTKHALENRLPDSKPVIKKSLQTNYLLLCTIINNVALFEVNKWISEIIVIDPF